MAILAIINVGETSAELYIDELNMTTTYKTVTINCNGYTSPNLAKGSISSTSKSWYPPSLQSGIAYPVTWFIESSGGSTASGSGSFKTLSSKVRPNNWYWSTAVQSGLTLNLPASDWIGFCNRINEFRDYKGLPMHSFTTAYYGLQMTATQYNQARSAISSMVSVPPMVYTGTTIYPEALNSLKDALNAVT